MTHAHDLALLYDLLDDRLAPSAAEELRRRVAEAHELAAVQGPSVTTAAKGAARDEAKKLQDVERHRKATDAVREANEAHDDAATAAGESDLKERRAGAGAAPAPPPPPPPSLADRPPPPP